MKSITEIYQIFQSCNGVCIDTRKLQPGQMFFAFKGKNTDGHKYVRQVLETKNCFAIIEDENYYIDDRTIMVDSMLDTLQQLAKRHRSQFGIPVIGITGSNGKTTSKELMQAVLSQKYNVHVTEGNYNNHLGVPITLLNTDVDTDILIVEMGANRLKDIEELCQIADPNHGIITNIGNAHVEGFGSLENILIGKTELYEYIADVDGVLFVNKNEAKLIDRIPENIDLHLYPNEDISINTKGLFLKIKDKSNNVEYSTSLYGNYNALNIQAALCIGDYFMVSRYKALMAISDYKPKMNRSQIINKAGVHFVMDAYNANPTSMKASLESLFASDLKNDKVLILGDMMELGDNAILWHREILDFLKTQHFRQLILVGPLFKEADEIHKFEHYDNVKDLKRIYRSRIHEFKDCIILLKASRSIQLESFLELF